jgi:hypothetical protein
LVASVAYPAAAQSTIRIPGERSAYHVELEPHLVAGLFGPPGGGTGAGLGAGARASFEIVPDGFLPTVNDSVAIGVGIDFGHYAGGGIAGPGSCTRFTPGPGGTNVCVEVSQPGASSNYAFLPVVMQWNFWLTRDWSVFGEPGLTFYWFDLKHPGLAPVLELGGRYRLSDTMTLTLRVGYPTFSIGVSFLL